MDMGLGNIDWNAVDENAVGERPALPEGYYTVSATRAGMEPTKNGPKALKIEWTVQSGDNQGHVFYDTMNILHPNDTPRRIAHGSLKKAFLAMGKQPSVETDDLLFSTIVLKVAYVAPRPKPGGGTYGASNDVKDYLSLSDAQERFRREQNHAGSGNNGGGQQQQQQNNGGNTGGSAGGGDMPWE